MILKRCVLGSTKRILRNKLASVEVDLFGGAITDFHLLDGKVNPLTFKFSREQMPVNNRQGAPYQGHFLCLGRWGEPSAGEISAGLPDHGEFANIAWECLEDNDNRLSLQTTAKLEGLHIERIIKMQNDIAVFQVQEKVTNINPLGRLYNMVQHPTLAAPFLDQDTIVYCNAASGFNHKCFKDPEARAAHWPNGIEEDGSFTNLSFSSIGSSSVFSFIVNKDDGIGWVAAYSPNSQLLFGYCWQRSHYPWINLWQDWSAGRVRYRGLEFGTSGIHQPFQQILDNGTNKVFGENTMAYIDAGETVTRSYLAFLQKVEPGFAGVDAITVGNDCIQIKIRNNAIVRLSAIFNH